MSPGVLRKQAYLIWAEKTITPATLWASLPLSFSLLSFLFLPKVIPEIERGRGYLRYPLPLSISGMTHVYKALAVALLASLILGGTASGSETNSPHWSEDTRLITNHREIFLAHVSPSHACSGSHSCGASIIPYSLTETIFPLWNRTTDAPSKPARVPAKVHSNTHSKKQTSPVT